MSQFYVTLGLWKVPIPVDVVLFYRDTSRGPKPTRPRVRLAEGSDTDSQLVFRKPRLEIHHRINVVGI